MAVAELYKPMRLSHGAVVIAFPVLPMLLDHLRRLELDVDGINRLPAAMRSAYVRKLNSHFTHVCAGIYHEPFHTLYACCSCLCRGNACNTHSTC
jgi:hypothetical protein